jgi:hypothetical protein
MPMILRIEIVIRRGSYFPVSSDAFQAEDKFPSQDTPDLNNS